MMRKNLFYLFISLFILSGIISAQTEKERWYKKDADFTRKITGHTQVKNSGVTGVLLAGYGYLISDHDGDNCPFEPTCSAFAAEAVKQQGIFKGLLMFADRFTRDTNLFKDINRYGMSPSGRLYDPVENNDNDDVYFYHPNHSE